MLSHPKDAAKVSTFRPSPRPPLAVRTIANAHKVERANMKQAPSFTKISFIFVLTSFVTIERHTVTDARLIVHLNAEGQERGPESV